MSNENKIRILYVQPGKYPEERLVANELHPLQRLVGGYMQAVYPWSKDKVALVCNDSGKVDGLPLNRCIEDYDVIAGNFFICGFSGEEFCSLTDKQFRYYEKLFRDPELFLPTPIGIMPMKCTPDQYKRLMQERNAALGRVRTVLQAAWLRLKAILARTIRRAAGSLLALLGAGGVVLLLAMVIGAAAAVIGSPMGILFADESGDPNSIRIAEIVAETNADFGTAINDIVSAHPECSETTMDYDYEDGHTWASYWPEVLAVFAVQNSLNNDGDVVVIDEGKKQLIQDTFWAMHKISAEVEEITATPEPTEDEPDPEPVTEYILHITVSSKSVDALADLYRFTQDQRDILHQLLSEKMRPSLLALCGGTTVADGELCWPLPGHTYISCHFGEVDAFGNAGHRGTDIPAPEGTPILAAHSGTVLVSGWNDSYGNQVLLDNGAGLSTRYAHMTQTAVTAGEAVTAGQVIGYVGSTGDSTGNHLHFEVMQNGVRMNPLELVFAQ